MYMYIYIYMHTTSIHYPWNTPLNPIFYPYCWWLTPHVCFQWERQVRWELLGKKNGHLGGMAPRLPEVADRWWSYFSNMDTLWLCQNSYWKWPFIVDFPIENGDFP